MELHWTTRYYRLVMPIAGVLAMGTILVGMVSVATATPDEGTENGAKPMKTVEGADNTDLDHPAVETESPEKEISRKQKQAERMQMQAEQMHREMEEHLKRMIEEPFGDFGDVFFKPPKWFQGRNGFRPPKHSFSMPEPDDFKPGCYRHSSHYSTSHSWSQVGERLQYRQRIGGLDVGLRGTVSDQGVDIQTIEIEARPGKTLSFNRLEDVPAQYRDEVKSAIKDARQYAE